MTTFDLEVAAHCAIATVDDPEYPGISIIDLGLLESLTVEDGGRITVGLVPTFAGCPALHIIANDVAEALYAVNAVQHVDVKWLRSPVWEATRVSERGQRALADQFTVAVQIGSRSTTCPRCGETTSETSMFGPSRCRSVHRCEQCAETIEVMRS